MSRVASRPPTAPAATSTSTSSCPGGRMAGPGLWGAPAPRCPLLMAPLSLPGSTGPTAATAAAAGSRFLLRSRTPGS